MSFNIVTCLQVNFKMAFRGSCLSEAVIAVTFVLIQLIINTSSEVLNSRKATIQYLNSESSRQFQNGIHAVVANSDDYSGAMIGRRSKRQIQTSRYNISKAVMNFKYE